MGDISREGAEAGRADTTSVRRKAVYADGDDAVQHDRIRLPGSESDRFRPPRGRHRLEPLQPEVELQQPEDHGIVVDEQHGRHATSIRVSELRSER